MAAPAQDYLATSLLVLAWYLQVISRWVTEVAWSTHSLLLPAVSCY